MQISGERFCILEEGFIEISRDRLQYIDKVLSYQYKKDQASKGLKLSILHLFYIRKY